MHSQNHWGGSFEIDGTEDDQSRNMDIDRGALQHQQHHQLDETQQSWLLGPPEAKKKDKYIDLGCVVVKRKLLWWMLWAVLGAFVLIGVPIIIAKNIPKKKPHAPPPDKYTEALHKALLFFNAQKSGKLPKNNGIPWRGNSALNDGSTLADVKGGLVGGYYDAGDNIKFHFPMAFSMTLLSWSVVEYSDRYKAIGEYDHVRVDMDRADYHQHQFLMPPPAPALQQQMYIPMMDDDMDEQQFSSGRGGGGGRAERKRRFTEEQIRSLESMFHAHHAKLEPREKAELARELGLQPRQVAIWFQNKRARWRTKQLEHDFAALRAKYDALHSRVDALKQDKLALTAKVHELSERLRERDGSGGATTATASSSSCNNGGSDELHDDDKRNVVAGCVDVEPLESCVLGGTSCATPADVSVESECGDHLHYDGAGAGFPADSFCATPELWEPWTWPPIEWNAVA